MAVQSRRNFQKKLKNGILRYFSQFLSISQSVCTAINSNGLSNIKMGPKYAKLLKNRPFRANLRPFYGLRGVAKTGFGALSANALAFSGKFAPGTPGMD